MDKTNMTDHGEDLGSIDGFLDFQARLSGERIETCAKKNNDYADPGIHEADDYRVFRNFMAVERLGICSAETGILVRISDKFMRLANLTRPGHEQQVKDESILDTAKDLQNYVDLLVGVVTLKRQQRERTQ